MPAAKTWIAPTPEQVRANHETARLVEERRRTKSRLENTRQAMRELEQATAKLNLVRQQSLMHNAAYGRGLAAMSAQTIAGVALPSYHTAALDLAATTRARQMQAVQAQARIQDHHQRVAVAQQLQRDQAVRKAHHQAEVQRLVQTDVMKRQAALQHAELEAARRRSLEAEGLRRQQAIALQQREADLRRREEVKRQEQVAMASRLAAEEQARREETARFESQLRRQSAELDKREHKLRMTQMAQREHDLARREWEVEEERRAHLMAPEPAPLLRPPAGPLGHRRHASDSRLPSFGMDDPSEYESPTIDMRPRVSSHAPPVPHFGEELARERQARMMMEQELEATRMRASRAEDQVRRLTPHHTPHHSPGLPPVDHFNAHPGYHRSAPPVIHDEFGYGSRDDVPLFATPGAETVSSFGAPTPQWPAGDPYPSYGGGKRPPSRAHSRHPSNVDDVLFN